MPIGQIWLETVFQQEICKKHLIKFSLRIMIARKCLKHLKISEKVLYIVITMGKKMKESLII